ncbi:uncharacterized protein LOC131216758 [Anopheles bellator]|uniref:uncharacterized protein LOC131216758 n=1 Tax=Anopheles bellator TaxID=139047 RepID=UPI002648E075|nr:uncharacterized protein LOC131216758 [Anopheles bellator]
MNLNDLPEEVLCQIFDKLDLCELKLASLVCRRWAELTFSGQRMNRVWLVQPEGGWKLVLNTRRSYRNILQRIWPTDSRFESLAQLLRILKPHVRMLDMRCSITFQQLRCVLQEVPELQRFEASVLSSRFNVPALTTNEPFPVLTKLKCLKVHLLEGNHFDFFRMNVPNLHSLTMRCGTDLELKAWRYMSGQLKLVFIYVSNSTYCSQFLELTFPHLEDFTMEETNFMRSEEITSMRGYDFFRRHSLLLRLSVSVRIPAAWIRSISSYCSELTYLSLTLDNLEEGILESLVQLTKLRHLSLRAMEFIYLDRRHYSEQETKLFRGTLKSLESVKLTIHPIRVFLEYLFEAAPQLKCLEIGFHNFCDDLQALDCQFICEKFSCLRRLVLDVKFVPPDAYPHDHSVRIDLPEHLQELQMRCGFCFRYMHGKNVRWLRIVALYMFTDHDLNEIPEKFPLLKRLIIVNCHTLSMAGVERLHELMPSCRIDFDSHRFYPYQVFP